MIAPRSRIAAVAVAASVLTGCSGGDDGQGWSSDGMRAGPGVADRAITVAALTDLTGPFAPLGKGVTQAQQLYYKQFNDKGGACGRKIELLVRDHRYDLARALRAYAEVAPRSAAIAQIIGSPITIALRPRLETDGLLTVPQGWAHTLLGSKFIQVFGTTYDVDMINAVAFLVTEKGVERGDKIGHLYLEGDYGDSALTGSRWAAHHEGLKLVEQKVNPLDGDMTAQARAFQKEGVKAILVSVSPAQAAALVGVAASIGLDVPFAASNSAFSEELLKTPAGPALENDYYVVSAAPPMNAPIPAVKELADQYRKTYKNQPLDASVLSGFTAAAIIGEAVKRACAVRDLSREGIVAAHRSTTAFDIGLGGAPQNYTQYTVPAARASYILKPDHQVLGGMKIHRKATESAAADAYNTDD